MKYILRQDKVDEKHFCFWSRKRKHKHTSIVSVFYSTLVSVDLLSEFTECREIKTDIYFYSLLFS